jgi:hypothetical protein
MDSIPNNIKTNIVKKIKETHPNLNINEQCIQSLIDILKSECPHFNQN